MKNKILLSFVLMFAFLFAGCAESEALEDTEEYQAGYDAGYEAALENIDYEEYDYEVEYYKGVYEVSNTDGTLLCATPGGEVVYGLVHNSHFIVTELDGNYGKTDFKNMIGWVDLDDCTKVDDDEEYFGFEDSCGIDIWQVNTDHDPLNIRTEPKQNAKIIDSLEKGTIIEISEYDGKWGYVECPHYGECEPGWVNTDYCVPYVSMSGWVYVTEYGKKYHTKDCSTIQNSENVYIWHRDDASAEYDPCKVCGGW